MIEFKKTQDGCSQNPIVPARELHRLLGYPPGHLPAERVTKIVSKIKDWYRENSHPWTSIRSLKISDIKDQAIRLTTGHWLTSVELATELRQGKADQLAVVAVSAGPEAPERASFLWQHDRLDESFILDAYSSAVSEQLMARAGARISGEAEKTGRVCLRQKSPGYGDWTLKDQLILEEILTDRLAGPLEVLPSGMLRPEKSMLGVFGLTQRRDLGIASSHRVPCSSCDWSPCEYRRSPYVNNGHSISEIAPPTTTLDNTSHIARAVEYDYPRKALMRWTSQHLRLQRDKAGIEAVFLFHGTTCSNMGIPIKLRYEVKLDRKTDGYWIRSASLCPEENDGGFKAMCAYLENPKNLMMHLGSEHPLRGHTLEAAVQCKDSVTPSGCVCKESDRNHKWKIVFQTIHYALKGLDANTT